MQSHESGGITGTRLGAKSVIHTIPITFADVSGVAKLGLTLKGTVHNPGAFRILGAVVKAPFNNSVTSTLSVGIVGAGFTDMINAQDLKAAAGTNITLAASPIKVVTADTEMKSIVTNAGGTAPTVGATDVFVEVWESNLKEPTPQGD